MTITPTALLSLPIITTGTESGTWGDVVDNGLTSYLDIAIAGGLAVSITTADVTLAKTAGTSAATGIVSTTAQYAILNVSGAKTAARSLNLPITSKYYLINNAGTSTGGPFLLTVRGVTPTTGVTLVDGEKAIVAWNGTDYVKITSTPSSLVAGGITYGTGASNASTAAGTSGNALISAGAGAPAFGNLALGTANTNVSGALTVTNGGTGAATLASNNVLLGNGTGALQAVAPGTTGNVLTSNGTTWASTAITGGVSNPQTTLFTTSGSGQTFNVPAGVTKVKVTIIGGGGAGGTAVYTSGGATTSTGGAGGGGGGAAVKWLSVVAGTLTVTVGAASGTSSVASGTNNTITTVSATGNAGIGSSGDLNIRGGAGTTKDLFSGAGQTTGGNGGSSILGGGAAGGVGVGTAGGAYGAGGSGGGVQLVGCAFTAQAGGAGSVGLVMFEY